MSETSVLIAIVAVVVVAVLFGLRGRLMRSQKSSSAVSAAPSEEMSELELDRAMGRISEEDYVRFRRELEGALDQPPPSTTPTVDEGPVRMVHDGTARAESLVRQWAAAARPVCASCGERPEPSARYCSSCGASLAPDGDA